MAITQNTYTGNGLTTLYTFSFPYLSQPHVVVTVNAVATTAFTFANSSTIQFTTPPASGSAIKIYRATDNESLYASFSAGSAVRAQDLNAGLTQTLYVSQEIENYANSLNLSYALATAGGTMTGNLNVPSLNGSCLAGMRNRIINGSMELDRRNTGASVSIPTLAYPYTIDRWYGISSGAAVSLQQITLPGTIGYTHALRVTGAAGNTQTYIGQKIENSSILDLPGQTVTASFYAASSLGTTLRFRCIGPTTGNANDYTSWAAIYASSFVTTSTYTLYSFTFVVPPTSNTGLGFEIGAQFGLTSGTFDIYGCQLELGTIATPFERRHRAVELALCQRYYYLYDYFHIGMYGNANAQGDGPLPVEMRATPTISWTDVAGTASSFTIWNGTANTASLPTTGGLTATRNRLIMDATMNYSNTSSAWLRAYNVKVSAEI